MNCKKCLIPLIEDPLEGMFVCLKCGQFMFPLVNTFTQDEKVYDSFNSPSVYIRLSHFKETLLQLQGKQTKRIPEEKFKIIKDQFVPQPSITENIVAMKSLLKKLKFNKYIKITNNILTNLGVISPPVISDELEQVLCLKFTDLEENFCKLEGNLRKNMLPLNFLLFKIFQELGLFQYFPYLCFGKNQKLLKIYENLYLRIKN